MTITSEPPSPLEALDLSIVAAVNDETSLQRNLLQSPILVEGNTKLLTFRDQPSASIAYNKGLLECDSEYVAFVHQDVYLPRSWEKRLRSTIGFLNRIDPNWAILGAFGIAEDGRTAGRVWSSGLARELGEQLSEPIVVASVDELAFVVRRASACSFDEDLPSFHLYGTDIVQMAATRNMNSYAADIPLVHNSRPVGSLGGGFAASYNYMRTKWNQRLPLQTLIVPVTNSPLPLWRARFRAFKSRRQRMARAHPNTSDPREIAKCLQY